MYDNWIGNWIGYWIGYWIGCCVVLIFLSLLALLYHCDIFCWINNDFDRLSASNNHKYIFYQFFFASNTFGCHLHIKNEHIHMLHHILFRLFLFILPLCYHGSRSNTKNNNNNNI